MADWPRPRAIVFDFDGVILESVEVKGRAFRRLFAAYPAHVDAIEQYHRANGGVTRDAKIAWFYRERLGREAADAEIAREAARFGEIVAEAVRTCPFVPGAREFIERHAAEYPLFAASAAPELELREIVADRGLASYFTGVYGSPPSKSELLARIAGEVPAAPADLLFVGDSRQDALAARNVAVPFVARLVPGQADEFGDVPRARIHDLTELDRCLPRVRVSSAASR